MSLKLILFLVAANGFVFATEPLTVDQAVHEALVHNPTYLAAKAGVTVKSEEMGLFRKERWPRLSTSLQAGPLLNRADLTFSRGILGVYPGIGPIPGQDATFQIPRQISGFSLTQVAMPLTQQPRLGIQVKNAGKETDIAAQQADLARLNLENQVRNLYFQLLALESAAHAAAAQVTAAGELVRFVTSAQQTGTALPSDVLNATAKLGQAQAGADTVQQDLQDGREQLNLLMGRDLDTPFTLADASQPPDAVSLEEARSAALSARPEIKEAEDRLAQTGLALSSKRWEYVPDVNLMLSYLNFFNSSNYLPNQLAVAGLSLTWEPWDWGRKRNEAASLRAKQEQAQLTLTQTRRQIELEAGKAWRDLVRFEKDLEAAHAATEAAAETLRVTRERNVRQAALLKDVLEAQSNWEGAGQQEARARAALAIARANFEAAIGKHQESN